MKASIIKIDFQFYHFYLEADVWGIQCTEESLADKETELLVHDNAFNAPPLYLILRQRPDSKVLIETCHLSIKSWDWDKHSKQGFLSAFNVVVWFSVKRT